MRTVTAEIKTEGLKMTRKRYKKLAMSLHGVDRNGAEDYMERIRRQHKFFPNVYVFYRIQDACLHPLCGWILLDEFGKHHVQL